MVAGRRRLCSADTVKLLVQRTRTVVGARAFIYCCHLDQSTSRAQSDVLHPDILAEAENFLHQLDNLTAAHLSTV